MSIFKHPVEEELKQNSDPSDTPLEDEINSNYNTGPIDTSAELKRYLEEKRKQSPAPTEKEEDPAFKINSTPRR